jgi:hypothetical protein
MRSLRARWYCLFSLRASFKCDIDGVAQQIAYTDVHTANVATSVEPTQHALSEQVDVVIVDTEAVRQGVLPRNVFNSVLDRMISDIELQCSFAEHKSWHFFGELISEHFNRFFKENGHKDLGQVRQMCLDRFQRLWIDVCFQGG